MLTSFSSQMSFLVSHHSSKQLKWKYVQQETSVSQIDNTRYPSKEDGAHGWAELDVFRHPFWY